jgi:hypothetical protein
MKKRFFTIALALIASLGTTLATERESKEPASYKIQLEKRFTSLQIDDDINVVLTNTNNNEIVVEGSLADIKSVVAAVADGRLAVWMSGAKRGNQVTVYIPAAMLDFIAINGDSELRTNTVLNNPRLEVEVNGLCKIHIRSFGKVHVSNLSEYEFKKG